MKFTAHSRNLSFPFDPAQCIGNTNRHVLFSPGCTWLTLLLSNSIQSQGLLPHSAVDIRDNSLQFGPRRCPLDSLNSFQMSNNAIPTSHQQDLLAPLFDLNQPQYPHSALMPHFIQVFIQHLGTQCPFIAYDDTLDRFLNGKLPPLLSNSIASLAVRYFRLLRHVDQYLTFRQIFSPAGADWTRAR